MHAQCGFIWFGRGQFVSTRSLGIGKRFFDICTREVLCADHAVRRHVCPTHGRVVFVLWFVPAACGCRTRDLTYVSGFSMCNRHRSRRQHDGLGDGFGADRAGLHAVQSCVFVVAPGRGFEIENLHVVARGQAGELGCKLGQLGNTGFRTEQGLFVIQQFGFQKIAVDIHHHHDINRFTAVSAHRLKIYGLKHIGFEFRLGIRFCGIFCEQRPQRHVRLNIANQVLVGKQLVYVLFDQQAGPG